MPQKDEVIEDESAIIDETETEEAEDEGKEDEGLSEPDTDEPEGAEEEEPSDGAKEEEPSASDLKDNLERIKQLEEENAKLKGEHEDKPAEPPVPSKSQIQNFVRNVSTLQREFAKEGITPDKQFEIVYNMTDQMLGAVLADNVNPVQDNLAARVIQLENEIEIRDMRSDSKIGSVFGSLEPKIRSELKKIGWSDRIKPGTIRSIFHRLIGENGGTVQQPKPDKPKQEASKALKDISSGTKTVPSKGKQGIQLNTAQETDFNDMVESGVPITRERYYARYKARADKAKADKRPVPKTLRSIG